MSMTGENVKEIFEEIIDDSVSDDLAYAILENADDELRQERDWYFLRAKTSVARATSDTYETGHALPANFDRVGIKPEAVRSNGTIYHPIDADDQEEYKDSSGYYYLAFDLDTETWKIYFTGPVPVSETVYVSYQKRGTEITSDNAEDTNVIWPGKRGMNLAWRMAERVASGADGDDINFRMSREQQRIAAQMKQGLVSWDTKFRLRAMGGRAGIRRGASSAGENSIDKNGGAFQ